MLRTSLISIPRSDGQCGGEAVSGEVRAEGAKQLYWSYTDLSHARISEGSDFGNFFVHLCDCAFAESSKWQQGLIEGVVACRRVLHISDLDASYISK